MSKLISNSECIQESNPLIDMFLGDTFSRTTAVLGFLQYSLILANNEGKECSFPSHSHRSKAFNVC